LQVHSLEEVSRNPSKFSKARYQLHVSAAVAPPTSRTLAPGSLANVDPRALVRLFRENAPSGFLNRPAFVQIFAKLAKNVDTAAVTALFDAFDSDGNGVIDTNEFVAGAVVLCGGDRDLKIRLSFEILDRNEDGVLDRGEMEAYMTSVFRVVQHSNPAVFARHNITPDALAVVTVDSAMTYADSNQDGVISFPEFRAWMLESDPTMASKAPSAQGKPAASKRASAPPQGLGSLEQIRAETGLGELTADDVIDAFLSESDERGVVDLGGFKRALDSIMQRAGRDPAKQRPGMAEALFKAVDSDGSGGCDIEELGSAFSVLCAGSRDDRCMAAFEMWDEDGDGFLDAHEMGKLLTSVYKVLYASNPSVEREMGVSAEELGRITAHDAIEQLDTDGDGRLNFSEFRAWYSKPMQPLRGSAEEAKPKDGSWVSLEETRRLTGLGRFNPAVVMEAFAVVADDEGMVSHADFVDTLRHLAPRGLSRQDVTRAEQVRERLFQLYAEGDRVDFSVLASALAMLSGGQAEDKKRAVFELIDVDLNGTVEREEFLRFMQSTMRVLYETQPGTRERIGVGPDDLAEIVTEDAFNRYDWNKDGRLTYDEFSAYWEAEGAEAIPEQVTLEATRELLGIDRYHVDDVFEMVAAAADHDGWISLRSFTKVMSDMARHGRQLTPEQDAQLNRTLARLYESFDTDRSGSVDFQELAAGLSVLGGGSRDARAEAAFRLFDPEGRGSITLKAMEDYLTAVFKTMIEVGGEDVKRRVNGASAEELAKATAEAVFTEADLNSDGTISYSEWQRFYSNESGQALESVMHEAPSHISIAEVKQRTGLDRMTAAECFEHFARAADEHGELSKAAFVSVFAHIAPLPHDARLSLCIDRLFQVLDANGDEKVDYVELSSGLSVLTGGFFARAGGAPRLTLANRRRRVAKGKAREHV
jgi:Ca2+-binding EF-hand superfamily protein